MILVSFLLIEKRIWNDKMLKTRTDFKMIVCHILRISFFLPRRLFTKKISARQLVPDLKKKKNLARNESIVL